MSLSDSSVVKIIGQLTEIFPEKKDYFEEKKKKRDELKDKIVLPNTICTAFFLPIELDVLQSKEKELKHIVGKDVYELKKNVLHILKNTAELKKISRILDPIHPISRPITVGLLEIIFSLGQPNPISKKDKEIYQKYWIPIANNLGLWKIRFILEDMLFFRTDAENFQSIKTFSHKEEKTYKNLFKDIITIIQEQFKKEGLKNLEIHYRKKNIYGIYRKMKIKGKNINLIGDFFAFRIITHTLTECYKVLDILHHLWPPYMERFKNYIEKPKANQYQSIHTTLQCLEKKPVEFQIRTQEMDYIAQYGPANHALYKKTAYKKY